MFYVYADGKSIYNPLDEDMQLIAPKLTLEIGKAGAFEFDLPPTNASYERLSQLATKIVVEMDDEEIFRGRVITNSRSFYNMRHVYAEGDLAYLVDSVVKGEKYEGTTHALFKKIISAHNARVDQDKRFTVGTVNVENREIFIPGTSEEVEDLEAGTVDYDQIVLNSNSGQWSTAYDFIETALIDSCGGYLRTRRNGNTTYIDYLTDYGKAPQEVKFGKNILDLTEEISAEEVFTVLIPIGDEGLTIESVNKGSDEIVDTEAVAKYGRIVQVHEFPGVNQASTLLENGKRYLKNNSIVPATFEVTAVDMHFVDPNVQFIRVGEQVKVDSKPHGVSDYYTCTKIDYDLEDPASTVYTFGKPRQTLTQRYQKDRRLDKEEDRTHGGGRASKKVQERLDDGLQDFFDAWINVDEESGTISLGSLYKDYENTVLVLENQVGIDLNAKEGNINLHALSKQYDELGQEVAHNAAQIDITANKLKSEIDINTAWCSDLEDSITASNARITALSTATEARISEVTEHYEKTLDGYVQQTKTDIEQVSDGLKAQVDITTKMQKTVDNQGKVIESNSTSIESISTELGSEIKLRTEAIDECKDSIAEIKITADNNKSAITLKADTITVDSTIAKVNGRIEALEGKFDKLTTGTLRATQISVDKLYSFNETVLYAYTQIRTHGGIIKYIDDKIENLTTYVDNNFMKKRTGLFS